nr:hypothetical protein [Candidatus Sigynarchaeum springense]
MKHRTHNNGGINKEGRIEKKGIDARESLTFNSVFEPTMLNLFGDLMLDILFTSDAASIAQGQMEPLISSLGILDRTAFVEQLIGSTRPL